MKEGNPDVRSCSKCNIGKIKEGRDQHHFGGRARGSDRADYVPRNFLGGKTSLTTAMVGLERRGTLRVDRGHLVGIKSTKRKSGRWESKDPFLAGGGGKGEDEDVKKTRGVREIINPR